MVLLTIREEPEEPGEQPQEEADSGSRGNQNLLDLGAFSQLLTSAQRSGLVSDADQIGYRSGPRISDGKLRPGIPNDRRDVRTLHG